MSHLAVVGNKDMELAHGIRSGDALSLHIFFDLYYPKVYNYISSRVENHRETEELVERTFNAALASLEFFDDTLPFDLWMYEITCSVMTEASDGDISSEPKRPGTHSLSPSEKI